MKKKEIIFKYIALISLLFIVLLNINVNIVKARDPDQFTNGGELEEFKKTKIQPLYKQLEKTGQLSNKAETDILSKMYNEVYDELINNNKSINKMTKEEKFMYLKKLDALNVFQVTLTQQRGYTYAKGQDPKINAVYNRERDIRISLTGESDIPSDVQEILDKNERADKEHGNIVNKNKVPIYKMPEIMDDSGSKTSLDDIIDDADKFVKSGKSNPIDVKDIKEMSKQVFAILTELAIGVAVIIGLVLGIKLMLASVEEKAEAKKMMWVYLVGCVISFGAFGIWQIAVEIISKF